MSARAHAAKLLRPEMVKKLGIATWVPTSLSHNTKGLSYKEMLLVDIKIRQLIEKSFPRAAVLSVSIERPTRNKLCVTVSTTQIGNILGGDKTNEKTLKYKNNSEETTQSTTDITTEGDNLGGNRNSEKILSSDQKLKQKLEKFKLELKKITGPAVEPIFNIQEPNNIELLPQLYGEELATEIANKGNLKTYINRFFSRIKRGSTPVSGVRIILKGRLSGSTMARTKIYSCGNVSKKTFSEYVDEYVTFVQTNSGTCGIRITLQGRKTDVDRLFDHNLKEKQNANTKK